MEMRPDGREALRPAYRWIIRRILRNASMTGLLYPPRWFGTPGRLESVKKTHQVARVGMGSNSESAVAGLGSDICRVRVSPGSVDAPSAPLQRATRHQPGICL